MYVCEDNVNANEYDFKKALDLLHFVADVWCTKYHIAFWNTINIYVMTLEMLIRKTANNARGSEPISGVVQS